MNLSFKGQLEILTLIMLWEVEMWIHHKYCPLLKHQTNPQMWPHLASLRSHPSNYSLADLIKHDKQTTW